jgi:hypothetical protein
MSDLVAWFFDTLPYFGAGSIGWYLRGWSDRRKRAELARRLEALVNRDE